MPGRFDVRLLVLGAIALTPALLVGACADDEPGAGGRDATANVLEAGGEGYEDGGAHDDRVSPRTDRLRPHEGAVVSEPRIVVVRIGAAMPDLAARVQAVFGAPSWRTLTQYGIGEGLVVGDVVTSEDAFFGEVGDGGPHVFDRGAIRSAVERVLGGTSPGPSDGAAFARNAVVVALPDGVSVDLGGRRTCIEAAGYHDFSDALPFAVLPPCAVGQSDASLAHELAELVTDPFLGTGWYDDALGVAGGEIADLCEDGSAQPAGFARLWSNRDDACVP